MKLKMGLIGTGGIGFDKHLPEYAKLEDVEIYAAADPNPVALARAGEQYAVPHLFADYEQLLALPEIDFVCVATPNFLHAPVAIAALRAGKHVHCEKPMAPTLAEARTMVAEARAADRRLMIGLNNRFLPANRHVYELVRQGFFGELCHINAFWKRRSGLPPIPWFLDKTRAGGGCLLDLGVHILDMCLFIADFPAPEYVAAHAYRAFSGTPDRAPFTQDGSRLPDDCVFTSEDMVTGYLGFAGNFGISLECSWASFTQKEITGYDLYGTKGGAKYRKLPNQQPTLELYTLQEGRQVDITPAFESVIFDPREFTLFVEAMRGGETPTIIDPETALHTMGLLDAIYTAAEQGKPVVF